LPLGVNRIELQILRIMQEKMGSNLTVLSAKTGLTREAVQRDFELYLQKQGLMEIRLADGHRPLAHHAEEAGERGQRRDEGAE